MLSDISKTFKFPRFQAFSYSNFCIKEIACIIFWVSQLFPSALPKTKFFWPNRIFYFLAESYLKKNVAEKIKKIIWWPNTILWNCMIRPVAESNKKKYIIRPVAESNKKKCLIRPKLLAESYRYRFWHLETFKEFSPADSK